MPILEKFHVRNESVVEMWLYLRGSCIEGPHIRDVSISRDRSIREVSVSIDIDCINPQRV